MTAGVLALALTCSAGAAAAQEARAWSTGVLRHEANWYGSPEVLTLARAVMRHQSAEGGWPKNTDLSAPPPSDNAGSRNTFDNDGTTLPLQFLARVATATRDAEVTTAFTRGLDYVLRAQLPNGGWPQYFPLRGGYYDHVTFNDDATVRVLTLLRDVATGREPYAFVDAARRRQADEAVRRGVQLILRTQIRRDGRLTAWAAQYDSRTLEPAWARRFEPPSLSGYESVDIVRFLMSQSNPSPEVVTAVDAAIAWFEASAIRDQRLDTVRLPDGRTDRVLVSAPGRRLWARFYDLQTGRPVYMGRDSVPHDRLDAIEHERRNGYNYVGDWAETLITRDYPRWRARVAPRD